MDMTLLQASCWRGKFLRRTQSGTPSTIETVSPEGTFCDTVQVPSRGGDMESI